MFAWALRLSLGRLRFQSINIIAGRMEGTLCPARSSQAGRSVAKIGFLPAGTSNALRLSPRAMSPKRKAPLFTEKRGFFFPGQSMSKFNTSATKPQSRISDDEKAPATPGGSHRVNNQGPCPYLIECYARRVTRAKRKSPDSPSHKTSQGLIKSFSNEV